MFTFYHCNCGIHKLKAFPRCTCVVVRVECARLSLSLFVSRQDDALVCCTQPNARGLQNGKLLNVPHRQVRYWPVVSHVALGWRVSVSLATIPRVCACVVCVYCIPIRKLKTRNKKNCNCTCLASAEWVFCYRIAAWFRHVVEDRGGNVRGFLF